MSTASKSNPQLWKRIVASVKSGSNGGDPGEWSARKAQIAVLKYKKSGGGYRGPRRADNALSKWTRQRWRTSDGTPSGGRKRYLPDAAWKSLSSSEVAATNAAKARGNAAGRQFVRQPGPIAKKVAKFRE